MLPCECSKIRGPKGLGSDCVFQRDESFACRMFDMQRVPAPPGYISHSAISLACSTSVSNCANRQSAPRSCPHQVAPKYPNSLGVASAGAQAGRATRRTHEVCLPEELLELEEEGVRGLVFQVQQYRRPCKYRAIPASDLFPQAAKNATGAPLTS